MPKYRADIGDFSHCLLLAEGDLPISCGTVTHGFTRHLAPPLQHTEKPRQGLQWECHLIPESSILQNPKALDPGDEQHLGAWLWQSSGNLPLQN